MHEFSIAVGIVDLAVEHAEVAGAKKVNEVELEIGELAGVIYEAMETAMDSAVKGTILEGAAVVIRKPPGKGRCTACGAEFRVEQFFDPCPACGEYNPEIISGKELRLKSLNID
ncbi:MAG: hydrogenase maturation nickel metallochaperone HypA [Bacteroidales bacterium]